MAKKKTRRKPAAVAVVAAAPAPAVAVRAPVFLLCGGRRTGSTLLQRLLISTGEVLVWGEHGGKLVRHLGELTRDMRDWMDGYAAPREHFETFRRSGFNAWIPNMNPPLAQFEEGCRALLNQALAQPARDLGYPGWGFKEVRYGRRAARFLASLYPDAAFVLLVRNPEACLRSVKSTEWGERAALKRGPLPFLKSWATLSEQMLSVKGDLKNAVLIRYEDFLEDTPAAVKEIARVTGIPESRFKTAEVLGHKEGGPRKAKAEFSDADRQALANPDVRRVAKLLGY